MCKNFNEQSVKIILSAYVHAVPYTNNVEDDDESIEVTDNLQKFSDTRLESDDWNIYGRRDDKKLPAISEDAIFLAHEKYCQYFYVFDGRESYLLKCASGYRFDAEKLQCLRSRNMDCGKRKKNVGKKIFECNVLFAR